MASCPSPSRFPLFLSSLEDQNAVLAEREEEEERGNRGFFSFFLSLCARKRTNTRTAPCFLWGTVVFELIRNVLRGLSGVRRKRSTRAATKDRKGWLGDEEVRLEFEEASASLSLSLSVVFAPFLSAKASRVVARRREEASSGIDFFIFNKALTFSLSLFVRYTSKNNTNRTDGNDRRAEETFVEVKGGGVFSELGARGEQ